MNVVISEVNERKESFMSDETALIPVVTKRTTVYTSQHRLYVLFLKVKRGLVDMMTPGPVKASPRLVSVLAFLGKGIEIIKDWLSCTRDDIVRWFHRLREAHAYSRDKAKHKRQIFARDTVSGKLKLERERNVNRNTPVQERLQSYGLWEPSQGWENNDWRTGLIRDIRNSQLIMSGAQGPELP